MATTTIEHDGFSVSSNHETEDAMRAAMTAGDDPAPKTDEATPPAPAAGAASDGKEPTPPVSAQPPAAPAKPPKSLQARIDLAVAAQREAERDRDAIRERAARLEVDLAAARAAKPVAGADGAPPPVATTAAAAKAEWERYKAMPDAPQLGAFEDFADWTVAMNLFIADVRYDERTTADAQRTEAKTRHDNWTTRLAAARTADPAYDSKLNPKTPATQQMRDIVTESEVGPDLLLYLSEHQDVAQRISTLHPDLAARQMGILEGEIKARQAVAHSGPTPAPAISRAKPVIKPVTGSPLVNDEDVDESELDPDEFIRRGNARDPNRQHLTARR